MITGYVKSGVERASKAGVILVVTCWHLPIDYLPRLSFDEHASWHLFHLFIFPPPIFEPSVYENCTFKLGANAKKSHRCTTNFCKACHFEMPAAGLFDIY